MQSPVRSPLSFFWKLNNSGTLNVTPCATLTIPLTTWVASTGVTSTLHFSVFLLTFMLYTKDKGFFFFSSDLYLLHPFTGCNKQERSEQRAQYLKHLFPLCLCCLVQEFHSKGHCTSATQAFFRISDQTGLELNCNNTYKWPRTN